MVILNEKTSKTIGDIVTIMRTSTDPIAWQIVFFYKPQKTIEWHKVVISTLNSNNITKSLRMETNTNEAIGQSALRTFWNSRVKFCQFSHFLFGESCNCHLCRSESIVSLNNPVSKHTWRLFGDWSFRFLWLKFQFFFPLAVSKTTKTIIRKPNYDYLLRYWSHDTLEMVSSHIGKLPWYRLDILLSRIHIPDTGVACYPARLQVALARTDTILVIGRK